MNGTQRAGYLAILDEINWLLCGFCRYSESVTGESPCDHGEPSCVHPLAFRFEDCLEPGDDCWGFRPSLSIEDATDIVGLVLANGWDTDFTWWRDKQKKVRFTARKRQVVTG